MAAERDSFFASLLRFTSRECLGFPETFTFFSFFFAIAETETERERELVVAAEKSETAKDS